MLHRQEIALDVGLAIRDVVVQWTPYTLNDPDDDETGFRFSLIPSAPRWDGWDAKRGSWHVLLARIDQLLGQRRPEYAPLTISVADIDDTLNESLSVTQILLTDKIMRSLNNLARDFDQGSSGDDT